jgi:hypothetical protein
MTVFYFILGFFGLLVIGVYKACVFNIIHPKYYVVLPRQ